MNKVWSEYMEEDYRQQKLDKVEELLRKRKRPRNTAILNEGGPADRFFGRKKNRVVKKRHTE